MAGFDRKLTGFDVRFTRPLDHSTAATPANWSLSHQRGADGTAPLHAEAYYTLNQLGRN